MPATLELESTLTDRYQTTVPNAVRRALKLGKRDRIRYLVQDDGSVVVQRADTPDDTTLDTFLTFLAKDIAANPQHVRAIDAGLAQRVQSLVAKVDVQLDKILNPADE